MLLYVLGYRLLTLGYATHVGRDRGMVGFKEEFGLTLSYCVCSSRHNDIIWNYLKNI